MELVMHRVPTPPFLQDMQAEIFIQLQGVTCILPCL